VGETEPLLPGKPATPHTGPTKRRSPTRSRMGCRTRNSHGRHRRRRPQIHRFCSHGRQRPRKHRLCGPRGGLLLRCAGTGIIHATAATVRNGTRGSHRPRHHRKKLDQAEAWACSRREREGFQRSSEFPQPRRNPRRTAGCSRRASRRLWHRRCRNRRSNDKS